jgi:hypothetical protein
MTDEYLVPPASRSRGLLFRRALLRRTPGIREVASGRAGRREAHLLVTELARQLQASAQAKGRSSTGCARGDRSVR